MHSVRNFIESIGGVKIVRWLNRKNKVLHSNTIRYIEPKTEQFLKEYYKSDIELLEKLISIDLAKWK